jgi:hypothetical protein
MYAISVATKLILKPVRFQKLDFFLCHKTLCLEEAHKSDQPKRLSAVEVRLASTCDIFMLCDLPLHTSEWVLAPHRRACVHEKKLSDCSRCSLFWWDWMRFAPSQYYGRVCDLYVWELVVSASASINFYGSEGARALSRTQTVIGLSPKILHLRRRVCVCYATQSWE